MYMMTMEFCLDPVRYNYNVGNRDSFSGFDSGLNSGGYYLEMNTNQPCVLTTWLNTMMERDVATQNLSEEFEGKLDFSNNLFSKGLSREQQIVNLIQDHY